MRNFTIFASVAVSILLASCSSLPTQGAWKSKGEALQRGLSVEIGPDAAFRIRGDALEGAILEGRAARDGEGWTLAIDRMDWFGNWDEGWTQASFEAEGELSLMPRGEAWAVVVARAPSIGKPTSASIRLYGDYFVGEAALGLISRRWDRIKAAAELLRQRFPDAWYDYSEQKKAVFVWDLFARRVDSFDRGVRAFLFPELYGYAGAGAPPPRRGHGTSRGESISWDTEYSAAAFPEALREVRDSGTMLRDFEEGLGLWRLAFCWDEFWSQRMAAAVFTAERK
jgi:hypothetical protein